ncbi:MAG: hypothetical protein AAGB29_10925 [Planctomycetota bacterium]
MEAMTCRVCGANLHADDVNTAMGIAKCRHCDAVFAFGAALGGGTSAEASGVAVDRQRAEVERPSGFAIEEDAYRFRITQRWFTWTVFLLIGMAAFWNGIVGFMVFQFGKEFLNGSRPLGGMSVFMVLFFIPFVLIGLVMIYGVFTTFLNSTTIDVDDRELTIKSGPLPVPGNKTLPSLDIKQLYCKRKVTRTKNGTSVTYQLRAVMNDGKEQKLLSNLRQQSHALYVEQQVERVLGIKDEAVAGESV